MRIINLTGQRVVLYKSEFLRGDESGWFLPDRVEGDPILAVFIIEQDVGKLDRHAYGTITTVDGLVIPKTGVLTMNLPRPREDTWCIVTEAMAAFSGSTTNRVDLLIPDGPVYDESGYQLGYRGFACRF